MPVGIYERGPRGAYVTRYDGSCYCCGATSSGRYSWYRNRDTEDNALCGLCYRRLILNPVWNPVNNKKWNPICNKSKQKFKDRVIYVGHNPRQGICCWCFRMGVRTEMAHLKGYREHDPTYGTYELCKRCHRRYDLGRLKPAKTRTQLEILLAKTIDPGYWKMVL